LHKLVAISPNLWAILWAKITDVGKNLGKKRSVSNGTAFPNEECPEA
jgi:hypothetical protein